MFGTFNPRIPATKAADTTLKWSAKGLSLNLANNNTWTGSQNFNSSVAFNSGFSAYSTSYNYGDFYNYGTFYNQSNFYDYGNMYLTNVQVVNSLTIENQNYSYFYEYPYASSYTLSNTPIVPYSISGGSNDGGYLSDDGYGNISSNYSGIIATIDYNTGVVTDVSYGYVQTNYIYYQVAPLPSYSRIYPSGFAQFSDGVSASVEINSGGNALVTNGNISLQGISSGVGAPPTAYTNFNLYVDTATGQLYLN